MTTLTINDKNVDLDNLTLEQEIDLIIRAKDDNYYKEVVVNHSLGLVKAIARKYKRDSIDMEDLMQEGYLGINRAIEDYNPAKGKRFSTYSRWWITAFIVDYFRDNAQPFSLASSISTKLNKLNNVAKVLQQETGVPPSNAAIGKAMGYEEGYIAYLRKYLAPPVPIHAPVDSSDGDVVTLEQAMADDHTDSPSERLVRTDAISKIKEAIKSLSEIEQFVISKRYGLDGEPEQTLGDVGAGMGHLKGGTKTAERVRQIQEKAETKLRKILSK